MPLISQLDPTTFVNAEAASGVRARFEMRLRGQARLVFAFDDGRLSVEEPGTHPPDCVVSVDPVAGLLVSWKRMGLARAVFTGKVAAWGRRPWLAMRMSKMLRNP